MYGRELPFMFDREFSEKEEKDIDQFVKELRAARESMKDVMEDVKQNISKAQEYQKKYGDRRRRNHPFESGDIVLIKNHELSNKAAQMMQKMVRRFKGPYKLGEKINENTFEILTLPDKKKLCERNVEDIKLFISRSGIDRVTLRSPECEGVAGPKRKRRMDYKIKNRSADYLERKAKCDMEFGVSTQRPFDRKEYETFKLARIKRNNEFIMKAQQHPLEKKIMTWVIPDEAMLPPVKPLTPAYETAVLWVDEKSTFEKMVATLKREKMFSVDLEMSRDNGFFGPYISLIQIGTFKRDYLVDPFPLWNEVQQLKPVFETTTKIKIVHGGANDLLALQTFFGIYPVAVVDTQIIYEWLVGEKMVGFAKLVEKFVPDAPAVDKLYQGADWTMRPLKFKLRQYARDDVHLLIRLWQNLKLEVSRSNGCSIDSLMPMLRKLMLKQRATMDRPKANEVLDQHLVRGEKKTLFETVFAWREQVAKDHDVFKHELIMADRQINLIAVYTRLPDEAKRPQRNWWRIATYEEVENLRKECAKFRIQQQNIQKNNRNATIPVDPVKETKEAELETITITFENEDATEESENWEIDSQNEKQEVVKSIQGRSEDVNIGAKENSIEKIMITKFCTEEFKDIDIDTNGLHERRIDIEPHVDDDITLVHSLDISNDKVVNDDGDNYEVQDMEIEYHAEAEIDSVEIMKGVCTICYEAGHMSPICPVRLAEKRTTEIREQIQNRKDFYKTVCPSFFILRRKGFRKTDETGEVVHPHHNHHHLPSLSLRLTVSLDLPVSYPAVVTVATVPNRLVTIPVQCPAAVSTG
ncbi:unnamed protein product [Orchesella dallaii]|uniref:3'-5' exonuclease domain-containing protein n=1 Tax=Orchesella dallaii TaxID=48710 RepID=A0ABP1PXN7_9HEXA